MMDMIDGSRSEAATAFYFILFDEEKEIFIANRYFPFFQLQDDCQ